MFQTHEDENCHYVQGADGEVIAIAKAGLSDATRGRIQRLAQGGIVKGFAGGGMVDGGTVDEYGLPAPVLAEVAPLAVDAMDAGAAPAKPWRRTTVGEISDAVFAPAPAEPERPVDPLAKSFWERMIPSLPGPGPAGGTPIFDAMDAADAARATPGNPTAFSDLLASRGVPLTPPVVAPPVAVPPVGETAPLPVSLSTSIDAGFRRPGGGNEPLPPPDQGLDDGLVRQDIAARRMAAAQAAEAAAKVRNAQLQIDQQAAFDAESARQYTARQAQADVFRDEIRNGKIDPDRLYASLDSGQRIGLGISLFLGGFGAALSGGANQALAIFNKQVDKDLDAQQANLATKQSLLREFVAEGHDLRTARELARAHMLDGIAATMERDSAMLGGDKAKAIALDTSGKLQVEAAAARQKWTTTALENQVRQAQKRHLDAESARLYAQTRADAQQKATAAQLAQTEAEFLAGRPIPVAKRALLSDRARDEGVVVDGLLYAAQSKPSGDKAREAVSAATELTDAVRKLREARKTSGRAWVPGTGESSNAQVLSDVTKLAIKAAGVLGTLDAGSQEFLDGMVKNPGAIWTTDATIFGGLDALDGWAKSRRNAVLGAQLVAAPPVISFATE